MILYKDKTITTKTYILIFFALLLLWDFFTMNILTGGIRYRPQIYEEEHISTIENQLKKDYNSTMKPVIILWTNWKSGSSFVGQLLTAYDSSIFYSYEPLIVMGVKMIQKKNKEKTKYAIDRLKEIMNCQFNSKYFIKYFHRQIHMNKNIPIEGKINVTVIQEYCKQTKKSFMKMLRLTLDVAETVLNISNNIKILYMVRDPRATIRSRKRTRFCPKYNDCSDAETFCSYLKTDFEVIRPLLQKYPERFKAMRYEDLSLDPENYYARVLKFLGEDYTEKARILNKSINNRTYTRNHAFRWKEQMSFNDAYQVQSNCTQTLEYFGYRVYESKQDYVDLDPLLPKSDIFI